MCFHALGPKLANLGFDGYAGEARQTLLAPHAQHKPEMEPLSWNVTSQSVALHRRAQKMIAAAPLQH